MNAPTIIANRYEVLASLGRGGFGSVFKVKDLETDEILALKYLANHESSVLDARQFEREFQHLARLQHPHIVSVKDTGTDGDGCYFTMEYLEGVTLEEALKSPNTGLYQVLQNGSDVFREILIQICEALACIHSQGLIHRDLKPANIFLQSDQNGPHVKILDLGLVKFRDDGPSPLTEEGTMLGTVHYMSPEQIRGVHVGHRSDLYTLGVVLYEVLAGQKPFLGKNSAAVVLKHLNEVPVPPRVYNLDISHDLQLIVLKLLEKEPERRYRFANDLIADLVPSKSHSERKIAEHEPAQLLQHPRFLGRSEEMAQARDILADVQAGNGRALCISGPAGIGKTRFLEEIKADAKLRGMQVLHASCFEDRTAPFQPIIECIRLAEKQLGGLDAWVRDEDRNELARLFPELGDVQETINRSVLHSLKQEDLFIALLQLCKDLGHRYQLMFCIDDIQWADQGTLDFLYFLSNRLKLLPVFLCWGYRPIGTKSKLLSVVDEIVLDPLGPTGIKDLLGSMFGTEDIPPLLCDDIFKFSGGNPFAALELTKALFASQSIVWEASHWNYRKKKEALPAEVGMATALRMDHVSDIEKQILDYASVINRPFDFGLMQDVLEQNDLTLFQMLEHLVVHHFLVKDAQDNYSIFHNLIRETIYQQIPLDERENLHLKLAQKLSQSDRADEIPREISEHFLQAHSEREAFPFLIKAGDQESSAYLFVDGREAFEKSLKIAEKMHGKKSDIYLNVLCKYVDILRWIFDWDEVRKLVFNMLKHEDMSPYYFGYLARIVTVPLIINRQTVEAEKLLLDALQRTSDAQYDTIRIHLYLNLANVYWVMGNFEQATHCNENAVGLCQESINPFYRTFGHFILGHDHLANSRFKVAESVFLTALSEFEIFHKDKRYTHMCRAALREIYTYRGQFQKAEELSQQIIESGKNTGIVSFEMYETLDLGYIFFEQGKFEQAEQCYLAFVEAFKLEEDHHKLCLAYVRLGELYLSLGDKDQAFHYAQKAKKIKISDVGRQSQVCRILGKVYVESEDFEQAETYLIRSQRLLKNVKGFPFALASFDLGVFYFKAEKLDLAKEQVSEAADMFKKMGADHFFKKAQKFWHHMNHEPQVPAVSKDVGVAEPILDTADLLNEAIDRLLQMTQADRGLILRVEDGQPRLQTACSRHLDTTSMNDISTTVVQAAIASGNLIVTTDASNDPRFEDSLSIADSNVGSILCMPLKARNGQIIGAVYADRANQDTFSVQAVSFFKSFAAFVAIGLEYALKTDQLQMDLEKFSGMRTGMGDLVGVSDAMQHLYGLIEQIAQTDAPILLQGETGVGKGLVARTIHSKSLRAGGPFLSVNCGALPRELLESELFGHKKGAFTGATEDRAGLFEAAFGGTLFLDEIGEAPPEVQVLLLHVLEDKKVRRIGENNTRSVDVRVITATNRDLDSDVETGRFRRDLYYRLNVMTLTIPPLRDRSDDILLLAKHFLDHWNHKLSKSVTGFDGQVRRAFLDYHWSGNIRELENAIYRGVMLADDDGMLGLEHFSDMFGVQDKMMRPKVPLKTLKAEVETYERDLVVVALEENGWNVTRTAEKLGLSRVALGQKIKKYGIERPQKNGTDVS